MKKNILFIALILLSFYSMAQKKSPFPFRGGKEHMMQFLKDSLVVSPQIMKEKATGTVTFKFTSDQLGNVTKIVLYYADDAVLVQPVIDILKKSNRKWVLPDDVKVNDYLITFTFNFNPPAAAASRELQKEVYSYISNRKPIVFANQAVLDLTTLLPTIVINYDLPQ
jgi:hypothetical protein